MATVLGLALLLAATGLPAADTSTYGTKDDLLPGGAGMALRGNILFTTVGAESFAKAKRLVAVDITGTNAPKVVSAIDLRGFPQDLALAGNTAYVVDGLRLVAIDIANPAAMRILSETTIAETPEEGPQGIVLDGALAHLACRRKGVVSVDVSRPASPVVKGTVATPFARGVALHRAGGLTHLISADDTRGLHVIRDGRIVAAHPLKHGSAARIRVQGDQVFVANGGAFLSVFTLTPDGRLTPHTELAAFPGSGYYGSYAYDVLPSGNVAHLAAGESGILTVDLSDPARPVCTGETKVAGAPLIRALVRDGDRLFVNGGTMNGRTLFFTFTMGNGATLQANGEPLPVSE